MSNSKTGTYKKTDGTTITITEERYKKARKMTEEEIHEAALSDPDAQPSTDDELKLFKPVNQGLRRNKKNG